MVPHYAPIRSEPTTDLARAIADKYVVALQERCSSVVATPARAKRRRQHVRAFMDDVIRQLNGPSSADSSPRRLDPLAGGSAFVEAGVRLVDAADALELLFNLALIELCGAEAWPDTRVSIVLFQRIMADVTAIAASDQFEELRNPHERVNHERLAEYVTPRQAEVFELLVTRASTQAIAHELRISVNTLNHHFSEIFSKLQAVDRKSAVDRARELGVLVVIPAVVSGTITAINSMM